MPVGSGECFTTYGDYTSPPSPLTVYVCLTRRSRSRSPDQPSQRGHRQSWPDKLERAEHGNVIGRSSGPRHRADPGASRHRRRPFSPAPDGRSSPEPDILELEQHDAKSAKALASRGQIVFNRLEALPKPVIAAVNGFALEAGGCELAMACHVRIATCDAAEFGQPER